ncbi:hypothetical protein [Tautonia rosea]|uniref:hypothetical protein n=1 Tax=Tautonia rosea TaxID=2728037 RepID=UPI001473661D|nr:hypothetical protein [Tautonia rosea]
MWPFTQPTITFEHAVYGSFPFWHRGYDVLGSSPGCRAQWLSVMKDTCQRLGERLRDAAPPEGLVTRWLDDGHWLLLRPFSPGSDDVGRPDAAAFHAIFLSPESAQRVRFDPFRLTSAFRVEWGPETSELQPCTLTLPRPAASDRSRDDRVDLIVEAIGRGRRVLVESDAPIDRLASQVWSKLPKRLRHRRSLATWAYTDCGRFDLLGLPRLTGIDVSDRQLLVLPANPDASTPHC